jgi:hypothetical protein
MSPSVALPLLHAAQDETRDELAEMWARMLANGMDPNRSRSVRQSIIATVASLEPTDAIILQKAFEKVPEAGTQAVFEDLRSTLSVSADELKLSIENLSKLGCITDTSGRQEDGIIIIYGLSLSSLGREVVRACSL